ncbi:hypothetical protein V5O48_016639 [Marasmius crinis-equi]|uniref:Uncharacterized protein n=1 Tax=Marasmius crinis-equi TaxID=585013 RepID=A0ABR3ER65_9AGAR
MAPPLLSLTRHSSTMHQRSAAHLSDSEYDCWYEENKYLIRSSVHDLVVHRFTKGNRRKIRWEFKPKPELSPEDKAELEVKLQREKRERRSREIPLPKPTLAEEQQSAAEAHEYSKKARARLDRVRRMEQSSSAADVERSHQEYERTISALLEHSRRSPLGQADPEV